MNDGMISWRQWLIMFKAAKLAHLLNLVKAERLVSMQSVEFIVLFNFAECGFSGNVELIILSNFHPQIIFLTSESLSPLRPKLHLVLIARMPTVPPLPETQFTVLPL